jgi:hypothetical protein
MSEDLTQKVKEEVARVAALPLEEQPSAFAAIRDQLERTLNEDASTSAEVSNSSNQDSSIQGA